MGGDLKTHVQVEECTPGVLRWQVKNDESSGGQERLALVFVFIGASSPGLGTQADLFHLFSPVDQSTRSEFENGALCGHELWFPCSLVVSKRNIISDKLGNHIFSEYFSAVVFAVEVEDQVSYPGNMNLTLFLSTPCT